jgi:hypothetical protein
MLLIESNMLTYIKAQPMRRKREMLTRMRE